MKRDTVIGIATIVIVFATLFACTVIGTRNLDDGVTPVTQVLQEDDPGWDCHTMGNRICGPGH